MFASPVPQETIAPSPGSRSTTSEPARVRALLESEPYRSFQLPPDAKRIVTFLREKPKARLKVPVELDGARILAVKGAEAFSAYVITALRRFN